MHTSVPVQSSSLTHPGGGGSPPQPTGRSAAHTSQTSAQQSPNEKHASSQKHEPVPSAPHAPAHEPTTGAGTHVPVATSQVSPAAQSPSTLQPGGAPHTALLFGSMLPGHAVPAGL